MHCSGTSVLTAMLVRGGLDPGERLERPSAGHLAECYEDRALVTLHCRWLETATPSGPGHPDWGVSAAGPPDPSRVRDLPQQAGAFALTRDSERSRWVAEDPRATWFLPEWAAAVPDLRFVLVHRTPWDVVDSVLRLGYGPFCDDPGLVRRIWCRCTERIISFVEQAGDRCLVVSGEAVAGRPEEVWAALDAFVGLDPLAGQTGLAEAPRFPRRGVAHPIAGLYRELFPECVDLLVQLDALTAVGRPSEPALRPVRPLRGGTVEAGWGLQVVIPCRNDGAHIDEAIASVEAAMQERAMAGDPIADEVELTVVDDGSDDPETIRIMGALETSGIHVVRTGGVGLSRARLAGTATSVTGAVLPLDADNRIEPVLLAGASRVLDGTADIAHGAWAQFGMSRRVLVPPPGSRDSLLLMNTIDNCAVIRRSLIDDIGGWSPEIRGLEDWDLWLSALERGARFERLKGITFQYLVRPRSVSSALVRDRAEAARMLDLIVQRHGRALGMPWWIVRCPVRLRPTVVKVHLRIVRAIRRVMGRPSPIWVRSERGPAGRGPAPR
jgi:hypothetical protein